MQIELRQSIANFYTFGIVITETHTQFNTFVKRSERFYTLNLYRITLMSIDNPHNTRTQKHLSEAFTTKKKLKIQKISNNIRKY